MNVVGDVIAVNDCTQARCKMKAWRASFGIIKEGFQGRFDAVDKLIGRRYRVLRDIGPYIGEIGLRPARYVQPARRGVPRPSALISPASNALT